MPHLRFTRDQRGYENTFLVHTVRRRGKERSRLLYWFRSPPHVKVGRAALDEEAIRTIENSNPDIVFEWAKILEARPPTPEVRDLARPRRTRRELDRPPGGPASGGQAGPARAALTATPVMSAAVTPASPDADLDEVSLVRSDSRMALDPDEPVAPADEAALKAPATLEPSAAERQLGPEGLGRLRARHSEVLARISSQVGDPVLAGELRADAERLNADTWVTAAEVADGLEQFEQVLERIRQRLGPPPRRERAQGRTGPAESLAAPGDD